MWRIGATIRALVASLACRVPAMAAQSEPVLDDRRAAGLQAGAGGPWRLVSDAVMGGVSAGRLSAGRVAGRDRLRL